jgi:hypothetical protein
VTPLSAIGEDIVRRLDPEGSRHRGRIVRAWPSVAGAEVASHSRGYSLTRGELVVFVDDHAWANELSMMAEDYRTRLNQEAGEELVTSIRFIVSDRASEPEAAADAPERADGGTADRPREPLEEHERAQIRHAAAAIRDPELRDVAVRVTTREMERAKAERERRAEATGDGPQEPTEQGS